MLKESKIRHLNLIPIILISIILFKLINRFELVIRAYDFVISLISPFILGFAIAYLLNPLMRLFESKLKLKRSLAVPLVYLCLIGIIVLGITVIIPGIAESIADILKNMPAYINIGQKWISDGLSLATQYGISDRIEQNLAKILEQAYSYLDLFLSTVIAKIVGFTSSVFNIILGIVISAYFLSGKESFSRGIKKILYGLFEEEKVTKVIKIAKETDIIFSKYIVGQMTDSLIVGILCFIGLSIMKVRYALLFSVFVGFANMIPYFGPIIGLVPAVTITLFIDPIKSIWILVFILLLQQFDGLIMAPRILGEQIGIEPIWIMFAIIVGGGTFGVLGLLLSVPLTAVLKKLFEEYIDNRLQDKNMKI